MPRAFPQPAWSAAECGHQGRNTPSESRLRADVTAPPKLRPIRGYRYRPDQSDGEQCRKGSSPSAIATGSRILKQHIAICAGLYLICVAGAGSASAQGVFSGPRLFGPALAPYQIAAIARSYGLAPATGPVRRGSTYMLLATDD